jgi:hypothetical protein
VSLSLSIYDGLQLRLGTPDDVHEVMALAIAAAQENGLVNASQELLLRTVWPCLNRHSGLVGCIGKRGGGEIEGMVVLNIGTLFYSPEMCLEEKVCFVRPEYRSAKGGRANKLCEFSKSVADALNLKLIMGVFSSLQTRAKISLYTRAFGEPAGVYFLYGGKTGDAKSISA